MTWQTVLAGWAVGALGAFPAAYETMARPEREGELPWWLAIGCAALAAALWPVAWLALLGFAARRAGQ